MDGSEERGHQGFYPIHRDGTITQTSLPWDYHRSHQAGSQLQANLLLGQEDFFGKSGPFLHFCHAEKAIHAVPLESEVPMEHFFVSERPSLDPTQRPVDGRFLRLHQAVQ